MTRLFKGENSLRAVLLAVELGCVDHVDKSSLGLWPLTSLETAIWVDPELIGLQEPVTC
jgi:hypothetical protein